MNNCYIIHICRQEFIALVGVFNNAIHTATYVLVGSKNELCIIVC